MSLAYITRGNSSPQGKPRVYFCCHPKDQAVFLQPVAQELLRLQNCAVWYNSEPFSPGNWEERQDDLSQMQLFVLPVTFRLLTDPCPAMEKEFPFAVEHHIPILPLMQEPGLEKIFNEKCGDIQFLDANAQDSTALPYEEKLKKFLDSVCIGSELAQQIRDAFDAYIFLSYRKKDRRQARELMRLIHENDFCRDIAIWYDEFLTPGENFNDAIAEALQKSKLFTLVVTPSLLEKENYVMTTEYPMAQQAGKPILPVEMVATNGESLQNSFPQLPSCTDGNNAPALSAELLKTVKQLALQQNDTDPRHQYCIGLAYLSGIDVEVNHRRAVSLITAAGEDGYEPAIEKLVSMYQNGEGVPRDYQAAIGWQQKLIGKCMARWQNSPSESHFAMLCAALRDLGDYEWETGHTKEAKEVWEEKVLPLCRQVMAEQNWPVEEWYLVGCSRMGNLLLAEGKVSQAKSWFEKALEISEQVTAQAPTAGHWEDLAVSYEKLGEICQAQADLSGAKQWFTKMLAVMERLAGEPDCAESPRALEVGYEKLGEVCQEEGNLSEAKGWFKKSLEISQQLLAETDTISAHRDVSIGYEKMAGICQAQGDFPEAEKWLHKKLTVSQKLAEETHMHSDLRDLSVCYEKLGVLAQGKGELSDAKGWFEKGLAISQELDSQSHTAGTQRDLAVSLLKVGEVSLAMGDLPDAKIRFERGYELLRERACRSDTVEASLDLAVVDMKLSEIAQQTGTPAQVKQWLLEALSVLEPLSQKTKAESVGKHFALCLTRLGKIFRLEHDFAAAKSWFEKSLAVLQQDAEKIETMPFLRELCIAYQEMGNLCLDEGDLQGAVSWFIKMLTAAQKLHEKSHAPDDWDKEAVSWYKLGLLPVRDRVSYLEESIRIWSQLSRQCPDVPRYARNLKIVQDIVGEIAES